MIKQHFQKILHKAERGQAIILVAFAIIGLVAMVGLVTDTGILLIEYGKLKRGVDAAAVAAAQQYRLSGSVIDKNALTNAAKNFLQLNQSSDITSVTIHSCEDSAPDRPAICNPDPVGHPNDNRKLVEVIASKKVNFGFLRVIGIQSTTVTANSTGEAATIDLVMVIDTSGSMAYETASGGANAPGNDPKECNKTNTCQPMKVVKDTALDFLKTLYFPYDRVSIVTMTGHTDRNPHEILALTSSKTAITNAINGIKVFEPRDCDPSNILPGTCLNYENGIFSGAKCQAYENSMNSPDLNVKALADPSSCPSSNVGGALDLARVAFQEDPAHTRLDAFWVVVALLGGPANATDVTDPANYPNGFCPANTWLPSLQVNIPSQLPWCLDRSPSVRHADTSLISYTNPYYTGPGSPLKYNITLYDADDYARDMADNLAKSISGEGVTIFTIGLGSQIRSPKFSDEFYPDGITKIPLAESLLQYIAECAGENIQVITYLSTTTHNCTDPGVPSVINHGQYFFAPTSTSLGDIFDRIAKNIATKISQ